MADQCIVCLENLDSAISLQQLQGDDHGGGALSVAAAEAVSADLKPLPLAAASPTASSTTTNETTTTIKDLTGGGESSPENDGNVAIIQICGHILHDSCLKAWSGKANSCPICRQAFHLVEVYDKIGGKSLCSNPTLYAHKLTCGIPSRHPFEQIQSRRQEASRRVRPVGVAGREPRGRGGSQTLSSLQHGR